MLVAFVPAAAGTQTAAIQIASNDEDENPFEIALTGTRATLSWMRGGRHTLVRRRTAGPGLI